MKEKGPRKEIWKDIERGNLDDILDKSAVLHGHHCPGLALGVKAGFKAVKEMRAKSKGMEDVIAIVETNNCLSDGIQFVTGCTIGNNSLIFRDLGKTAVTVTKRNEEGIRLIAKPDSSKVWEDEYPEYQKLFEKIVTDREGTEENQKRFDEVAKKVSHYVVDLPVKQLFNVEKVEVDIPDYAPIHESYICDLCGEKVMTTRTVERENETLCLECSDEDQYELTGFGIECRDE